MRFRLTGLAALAAATLAGCGLLSPSPQPKETADTAVQKTRALKELEGLRPGALDLRIVPGLTVPALALPEGMALPTRPKPEWVRTGGSVWFPASEEVTGVGSCDRGRGNAYVALSTAEDRARMQVVEIVRARVREQCERVVHDLLASPDGREMKQERYARAAEEVIAQSELVLETVFVVDRWYEASSDTYWAFAAIDRLAAGEMIATRVRALKASVDEDYAAGLKLLGEKKALQAATALSRAARNAITLLSLRAQRRAVEPKPDPKEGPLVTPEMLTLWRASIRARESIRIGLLVCVEVDGKRASTAVPEGELAFAMRDLGFTVVALKSPWEMNFEETRSRALDDFAALAGPEIDCVVLAGFEAREDAVRQLMGLLMHYYQGKAQALVLDLRGRTLAAAIGFAPEHRSMAGYFLDFVPQSVAFEPSARRAAEGALRKAGHELGRELRRTLVATFNLSE